jgi:hypothetical protein
MFNYALLALELKTGTIGGEDVDYWQFENGEATHEVIVWKGHILATQNNWNIVLFLIDQIIPDNMSKADAGKWLSECDGFLAFDYRMLTEYARHDLTILNRVFDYNDVLDLVHEYQWVVYDENADRWVTHTGTKADYLEDGYPSKFVRLKPMPEFFGVAEDNLG